VKAPRGRFQSIADGVDRQRTGAARRVANASPVSAHSSAVAEAVASAAVATYRESEIQVWTLTTDGPQDLDLNFLPVYRSWNVKVGEVYQTDEVDFTVSGLVLSLLTAADARTDEVVQIQYDYLSGQAQPSTNALDLNVPYGSDGWRYNAATGTASWFDQGFDDSAWAVGRAVIATTGVTNPYTAPFTDGATGVAGSTAGVNTAAGSSSTLWIRRTFPAGTSITITYDEFNYYELYVNGTSLASRTTGNRGCAVVSVPDQSNDWVLAVRLTVGNGTTWNAIDMAVAGTEI
jgi:hypothetical protein